MCIDKINIKQRRFAVIAKMGESVFHAGDLANLWDIRNPATLYTTLTRYTNQGLLHRVYKGLYSIKPLDQLDPFLLGLKALHRYGYISMESVLFRAGIINQENNYITLISEISRKFEIYSMHYYSRRLADKYLFNPAGILNQGDIRIASVERAVADLLYYNPKVFLDNPGEVDQEKVKEIQAELGYPKIIRERTVWP